MKFSLKTLIWTTILLALVLAGAFALIPKPIVVESALVVEGPLRVSVDVDGKSRIREKYIVSAPVSGRLSRIELRAGDMIETHSLLAVILPSDPAMLDVRTQAQSAARVQASEATLQRSKSNSETARINFELAKQKFDRFEKMRPAQSVSQDEYDTAKADYMAAAQAIKTARFDTEIAQFELKMAQVAADQLADPESQAKLEPFEVFSPVRGKVLRIFQESSIVVTVGAPLLELGDPQNLEIEIDVLSTDAVRIKPGAELTIDHWGGEFPLQGIVRVIEPAAFTKISSLGVEEQRVNIIADFDELPERIATLGDGYRVEARITIDELQTALLVPNSALFRYQRQWHVMQVVNKTAVMTPVTIGLQSDAQTQILSGLSLGNTIIIYPSDEIRDGSKIRQ